MPYRRIVFADGEVYHIFNRGVARLPIFYSPVNYSRFLKLLDYYRFANTPTSFSNLMRVSEEERKRIWETLRKENNLQVEVLAFCLMPNHFHLLVKQVKEKGISNFVGNIQNSYVKYLNIKEDRQGPLFQSMFKAVRIETEEQLLHVSRYIHLNPSTSYIVKISELLEYPWSSLKNYTDSIPDDPAFVSSLPILSFFKNLNQYKNFVFDQAEYQKELGNIKHLIIE